MIQDQFILLRVGKKNIEQQNPIMRIKIWKISQGNYMNRIVISSCYSELHIYQLASSRAFQYLDIGYFLGTPCQVLRLAELNIVINEITINLRMRRGNFNG